MLEFHGDGHDIFLISVPVQYGPISLSRCLLPAVKDPGLAIISSIRPGSVTAMGRDPVTGYGIAIGIALGVLVGMAMDNLPLWIAVGVALGAAVGAGVSRSRARRNQR
jgi:hypothetical protein